MSFKCTAKWFRYLYTHTYIPTYAYVCVYMYVCICVCVCVCVCVYVLKTNIHDWEYFSSHRSFFRRRQWHPTPLLLPGKSHGQKSLVGCSPWGHDWVTSLSLFTFMYWRRKWQPTPVFLPGESQGWRSLVGCHLWGRTELDTTEAT